MPTPDQELRRKIKAKRAEVRAKHTSDADDELDALIAELRKDHWREKNKRKLRRA